jgi:hypothetical protein
MVSTELCTSTNDGVGSDGQGVADVGNTASE